MLITLPLGVQANAPSIHVPHVDGAFLIDGSDQEDTWTEASHLRDFRVYRPRPGLEAHFKTAGKIAHDGEALYLWMQVEIPREKLQLQREARDSFPDGDSIQIQLDPTNRNQRAYVLAVGAGGHLYDATTYPDGNRDRSWDINFEAKVMVEDARWTMEARIPFSGLRFDPDQARWSLQVLVQSWKHQQTLSWSPIDLNARNTLTQMGEIQGLKDLSTGRVLEFLPSLTAAWSQEAETQNLGCAFDADVGVFTL